METNPGIHCTFIDEFHIVHEGYAKHLAAMYTQMINQPITPTKLILPKDLYEQCLEAQEEIMTTIVEVGTSFNIPWWEKWQLPGNYIPGKFQGVGSFTQAPYPVGDITPPSTPPPQISPYELQENWLAQVAADLQYCDSRELYLDLLRTKLMTLPGYKYASPT